MLVDNNFFSATVCTDSPKTPLALMLGSAESELLLTNETFLLSISLDIRNVFREILLHE